MSNNRQYEQGSILLSTDADFAEGVRAAVDYRGDVSIRLKTEEVVIGFVYSADSKGLDLFPRDSSRKANLRFADILEIHFSGEDTSKGRSWEEWMKKKETLKTENLEQAEA